MKNFTAGLAMMHAATPDELLEACDAFGEAVVQDEQRQRLERAESRAGRRFHQVKPWTSGQALH